jgi:hypothetical protein
MSKKPVPWRHFLAFVLGAPFALAGIVLLIPPFTPLGLVLILIGGYPLYRLEQKKLQARLDDHPLENGIEKPWV